MALLAIAVLATAAGMRGYAGFATWAATAPDDVLAQLGVRFRRPSEKTFRAVLSRLDPADLNARMGSYFTAHVASSDPSGLVPIALDGKMLPANIIVTFGRGACQWSSGSPSFLPGKVPLLLWTPWGDIQRRQMRDNAGARPTARPRRRHVHADGVFGARVTTENAADFAAGRVRPRQGCPRPGVP
ncbi:hypothetical protein NJB1907Z4_C35890 [Mycobacterium pseudoshottsii]|uniref:H repeat-associated protein N-terminal domain-containing protein n=1 Tax=Mycobacterium pseudoshottsii TaxID=265949 RepID=A0A9N7QNH9_9MYCO|nr:hypothetical protein NJB1907Z4_C35890 [Mycobacterium pseudoshottsii]